jgi:DME family drug/metabolite transporter
VNAALEASPVRNRLLLIGAALLFSTGGAAIKAATLTGWQVASFRSGVAAVVLLAVLPEARRGWSWRLAPVGAAYAATLVLFVLATRLTTAANAIFLQSSAPLYVLRSDLIYVLTVASGMALLFLGTEQALATAPDPHRGNLLGVASGLAWALTVTGLRWLGRSGEGNPALAPVVAGNLLAFLAALPMALPVTRISGADVSVILYLGIVQIGLAYVLVTRAIRHVPAFEATTVLLLEPVMNPIWAWMVQAEKPGAWALAGGAVILSATLVNTWRQARRLRGRDYAPVGR